MDDESLLATYTTKETERLVNFNDYIGATNAKQLLCIWDLKTNVTTWIKTNTVVLCFELVNKDVFWGEQNGVVNQLTASDKNLYIDARNSTQQSITIFSYQTKFKDSITSISVFEDLVFFGDKNGEIRCCQIPIGDEPIFVLESGHQFGAFVWAIQADGARVFSGDSDGKLIVHDFWEFDNEPEASCDVAKEISYDVPPKRVKN